MNDHKLDVGISYCFVHNNGKEYFCERDHGQVLYICHDIKSLRPQFSPRLAVVLLPTDY